MLVSADSIYNYYNRTAYIQHDDSLIMLPFNSEFKTGQTVTDLWKLPADDCKVISVSNKLYAFYETNTSDSSLLTVSQFNETTREWKELDFGSPLEYLSGSAYMATPDAPDSVYVYGGYNSSSGRVSGRLVQLDLNALEIADTQSSLQPTGFYDSSSLLINHNTLVLVGGKTASGWVSLKQLAVWQYESWGFKSVSVDKTDTINSRAGALLLPVFSSNMITEEYLSSNYSDFSVDFVLMVGGGLSSGTYSSPNFARLDVGSSWSWTSLDTTVSLANSKTNNANNSQLSVDDMVGAAVIYDALVVVNGDSANYTLTLYNTTSFEVLESVDYSNLAKKTPGKSSKSLVIALSVLIPALAATIIALVAVWLYKKYKSREAEKQKEKDLKDIMEFYQAGNSSSTTFASHGAEKENTSYFGNHVKVNNYDDGDNLSISSWKRKRWQLESEMVNQDQDTDVEPDPTPEPAEKSPVSPLKRSLSTISYSLGRSLRRSFSYQSSIRSFFTAETPPDDSGHSPQLTNIPVLRPAEASNFALHLIPEDSSLNSFKLKAAADSHSMTSNSTICEKSESSGSRPASPPPAARTTSLVFHNRAPLMAMPGRSKDFLPPPEPDLENLDVQILVSSKRRSKLRVTNPDPDGPRKRTASNEHDEEE
ncbi:hypothetical protein KL930_002021 [Ogataea haglerorum]|uniref:Galactose oxidase n=1 Tax=Ogataea haglerorum TaxID=1937702 RepID=A0AAN6D7I6_9ASCO|nr:hypothetical protein KL915_001484 [Ogataea haglerorum]KAG7710985.1 hypothetical protein KL950_000951 [Ogataea haglerorum]KAG7720283.1 hypothetical protein KL913_001183 [Ogataea haglerorum]KAG7720669.1 hypothetical protein KL949_001541 [Ogataea haglerorum]KAG7728437.1 hypothetical protein KL933_001670 [Ogataea haglerorum]